MFTIYEMEDDDTSNRIRQLKDAGETVRNASSVIFWVANIIVTLVWGVVVTLLVKRGQFGKLAASIKVSLALYLVQLAAQLLRLAVRHALGYRSYRVATLLISFIFYVNHWIFTWHYLEAAALFKLTLG